MATANMPANDPVPEDFTPLPVIPAGVDPKPDRVYSVGERVLVPVSVLIAFLFDRLMLGTLWDDPTHLPFFSGVFWLAFLILFCVFFRKRLTRGKTLWIVAGLTAALCVWSALFDYRSAYGALTTLVIPAVLMAWCQFFAGAYDLKQVGDMALAWLAGWCIKPFISIPTLFGAMGSAATGSNRVLVKKILMAIAIIIPVMMVIIPLLSSADMVFGYYMGRIVSDFDLTSLWRHSLFVVVFSMLFYSYLWQTGYADKPKRAAGKAVQFDLFVSCAVLGAVTTVYLLFCTVQFTYLFAGAGLPDGMTYSEYAREGFAQIIMVCALNLLLFGLFLRYGRKRREITVLLSLLLGVTAVMLISGFLRLKLYVDTYGLTWLRLISSWFLVYLAVVIALCGVRMARERIPLIAVSAILLLGWYVVLGYMNPDALILRYNLQAGGNPSGWLAENRDYVGGMSGEALAALMESGADPRIINEMIRHYDAESYGLSSARLRRAAEKRGFELNVYDESRPEAIPTGAVPVGMREEAEPDAPRIVLK